MMKTYRLIICLCVALWASALSAMPHWTCDYHQYQYDMTVYFLLALPNGLSVSQTENFEVAAFVGNECRGVGEFQTVTGTNEQVVKYGYLRIRSNTASGEAVSFKYYDKEAGEEKTVKEASVSFVSSGIVGMPSSPMLLTMSAPVLFGDANGDGVVNIADVTAIINCINGNAPASFVHANADVNNDGNINIADVTGTINIINQ